MKILQRYIKLSALRPFDVILCRSYGAASSVIAAQNSPPEQLNRYSHAALVIPNAFVFEAIPGAVRAVALRYHANHCRLLQEPWLYLVDDKAPDFMREPVAKVSSDYIVYHAYRPHYKQSDGTEGPIDGSELERMIEGFENITREEEEYKSYRSFSTTVMASETARNLDPRTKKVLGLVLDAAQWIQLKHAGQATNAAKHAGENGRFCSELIETCLTNAGHSLFPGEEAKDFTPNDLARRLTRLPEAEIELEDSQVSPSSDEVPRSVELYANAVHHKNAEFGFSMAVVKGTVLEITRMADKQLTAAKNGLIAASEMCAQFEQKARWYEEYFQLMSQQTLEDPLNHPAMTWDTPTSQRFKWKSLFKKKPSNTETIYAGLCGMADSCQELHDMATKRLDNPQISMSIGSILDEHIEWMSKHKTSKEVLSEHLAHIPKQKDATESIILACRELQTKARAAREANDRLIELT